jgi:3-deoxy-D-manno-octulosonic-acid transferase
MALLLDFIYLATILFALPWLLYQRLRHGKYREGWPAKFWGLVPERTSNKPCLWLHAVSVGEVNLLEPIVKRWQRLHPDWDCVISTTTQTGYALAKKKYDHQQPLTTHHSPLTVFYCPLDFTWAVRRAMRRIRPTLLVLAELELWPNLVWAARDQGAKIAVINGRLSDKSFRGYRRLRWFVSRILTQIDLLAIQTDEYAERFLTLGAPRSSVHVTGSVKFDGARTNRETPDVQRLAGLAGIDAGDIVFLAGSTQEPEEALALSVFEKLSPEFPWLRLILVPRHPERFNDVAAMLDHSGVSYERRSQLGRPLTPSGPEAPSNAALPNAVSKAVPLPHGVSGLPSRVLLVDVIGELGHWWGTAHIAFVGGSLTQRGGQNMIEPAGYGAAISFGPNTWNFRDIVSLLLGRDAAVVVHDEQQLESFVRRCLTDPACAAGLGRRAQELVLQQQGAADRTITLLEQLVAEQMSAGLVKQAAA